MQIRDRIRELRRVKASDLRPNPQNWRTHPQPQQDALRGILADVGYADALLARELADGSLMLVDGHLRAETTPDAMVPVLVLDVDEDEAAKLLAVIDPLAAMAEADSGKLKELLDGLETDNEALQAMLDELGKDNGIGLPAPVVEDVAPIDRAAELLAKWGVKPGDLWLIPSASATGKHHRLLCGDSTKAEDVARVMGGERAHACVTDPPYGVGVDYSTFKDTAENVDALIPKVMPFILDAQCAALTPGVPAMWNYPKPDWVGAWVHPAPCGSCPWGFVGNNPILFYGSDPYLKSGLGRRPDSIVMASDRQGEEGHPTPKPLKVWAWLVERLTVERGQIVFDPFTGSGTTFIVGEQLARLVFGIEIEPKYVAVALERMANLGLKPERAT